MKEKSEETGEEGRGRDSKKEGGNWRKERNVEGGLKERGEEED